MSQSTSWDQRERQGGWGTNNANSKGKNDYGGGKRPPSGAAQAGKDVVSTWTWSWGQPEGGGDPAGKGPATQEPWGPSASSSSGGKKGGTHSAQQVQGQKGQQYQQEEAAERYEPSSSWPADGSTGQNQQQHQGKQAASASYAAAGWQQQGYGSYSQQGGAGAPGAAVASGQQYQGSTGRGAGAPAGAGGKKGTPAAGAASSSSSPFGGKPVATGGGSKGKYPTEDTTGSQSAHQQPDGYNYGNADYNAPHLQGTTQAGADFKGGGKKKPDQKASSTSRDGYSDYGGKHHSQGAGAAGGATATSGGYVDPKADYANTSSQNWTQKTSSSEYQGGGYHDTSTYQGTSNAVQQQRTPPGRSESKQSHESASSLGRSGYNQALSSWNAIEADPHWKSPQLSSALSTAPGKSYAGGAGPSSAAKKGPPAASASYGAKASSSSGQTGTASWNQNAYAYSSGAGPSASSSYYGTSKANAGAGGEAMMTNWSGGPSGQSSSSVVVGGGKAAGKAAGTGSWGASKNEFWGGSSASDAQQFDLKQATWNNDTGQASSSGTEEAARGKNNWSSNVEDRGGGYSGQQPHLQPSVGAGDAASWNNGAQWDDSALTQASQKIGAAGTAAKGSKASFVTGAIAGGKKGPQGSTESTGAPAHSSQYYHHRAQGSASGSSGDYYSSTAAASGEPAGAAYDPSGAATWGGGKSSVYDPTQQASGGGANAYGYAAYDHAKNRGKAASSSSQPPPAQQNTTGNSDQSESDRWAWAEQQNTNTSSSWTTQKEKGAAKADAKKGSGTATLAAAAGSAVGSAAEYSYDSANYFNNGSYDNSYSWSEAGAAKGAGAGATSSTSQGAYAHKKGAPRPGSGGPDQWYGAASQADNSGANYYQAPAGEGGAAPGAGAYSQQSQVPHITAKGKSEAFGGKPADPSSKGGKASSVGGKKKGPRPEGESSGGAGDPSSKPSGKHIPLWQKNSAEITATTTGSVRVVHAFARGRQKQEPSEEAKNASAVAEEKGRASTGRTAGKAVGVSSSATVQRATANAALTGSATSSGSESRGAVDQALPHTVSSASAAEEPATYDPRDYSYAYGYATTGGIAGYGKTKGTPAQNLDPLVDRTKTNTPRFSSDPAARRSDDRDGSWAQQAQAATWSTASHLPQPQINLTAPAGSAGTTPAALQQGHSTASAAWRRGSDFDRQSEPAPPPPDITPTSEMLQSTPAAASSLSERGAGAASSSASAGHGQQPPAMAWNVQTGMYEMVAPAGSADPAAMMHGRPPAFPQQALATFPSLSPDALSGATSNVSDQSLNLNNPWAFGGENLMNWSALSSNTSNLPTPLLSKAHSHDTSQVPGVDLHPVSFSAVAAEQETPSVSVAEAPQHDFPGVGVLHQLDSDRRHREQYEQAPPKSAGKGKNQKAGRSDHQRRAAARPEGSNAPARGTESGYDYNYDNYNSSSKAATVTSQASSKQSVIAGGPAKTPGTKVTLAEKKTLPIKSLEEIQRERYNSVGGGGSFVQAFRGGPMVAPLVRGAADVEDEQEPDTGGGAPKPTIERIFLGPEGLSPKKANKAGAESAPAEPGASSSALRGGTATSGPAKRLGAVPESPSLSFVDDTNPFAKVETHQPPAKLIQQEDEEPPRVDLTDENAAGNYPSTMAVVRDSSYPPSDPNTNTGPQMREDLSVSPSRDRSASAPHLHSARASLAPRHADHEEQAGEASSAGDTFGSSGSFHSLGADSHGALIGTSLADLANASRDSGEFEDAISEHTGSQETTPKKSVQSTPALITHDRAARPEGEQIAAAGAERGFFSVDGVSTVVPRLEDEGITTTVRSLTAPGGGPAAKTDPRAQSATSSRRSSHRELRVDTGTTSTKNVRVGNVDHAGQNAATPIGQRAGEPEVPGKVVVDTVTNADAGPQQGDDADVEAPPSTSMTMFSAASSGGPSRTASTAAVAVVPASADHRGDIATPAAPSKSRRVKRGSKIDYVARGCVYSRNGLLSFREALSHKGRLQLSIKERQNMWFTLHIDDLARFWRPLQVPMAEIAMAASRNPLPFGGHQQMGGAYGGSYRQQLSRPHGIYERKPGDGISVEASRLVAIEQERRGRGSKGKTGPTLLASSSQGGSQQNDQRYGYNHGQQEEGLTKPQRSRTFSAGTRDGKENEIQRQVTAILNKLAPERFKKLCETMAALPVKGASDLEVVALEIFDKATTQTAYCEMYSDMCMVLRSRYPEFPLPDGTSFTFTRALLNRAQQEFQRTRGKANSTQVTGSSSGAGGPPSPGGDEEADLNKARLLGNMKFIGQLFLRKLLSQRIVRSVVTELIHNGAAATPAGKTSANPGGPAAPATASSPPPDSLSIECVCTLLKNVGRTLEASTTGKEYLSTFIERLKELAGLKSNVYSKRIKFAIRDVLDLAENKWVERVVTGEKVKMKNALQLDAQREQKALQSGVQNPYAMEIVAGGRPDYFPETIFSVVKNSYFVEEAKKILAYYGEDRCLEDVEAAWGSAFEEATPDDVQTAVHYLVEIGFSDYRKSEVTAQLLIGLLAAGNMIEISNLCRALEPVVASLEDFMLDYPKADQFYHLLISRLLCDRKTVRLFTTDLFAGFELPEGGPATPLNNDSTRTGVNREQSAKVEGATASTGPRAGPQQSSGGGNLILTGVESLGLGKGSSSSFNTASSGSDLVLANVQIGGASSAPSPDRGISNAVSSPDSFKTTGSSPADLPREVEAQNPNEQTGGFSNLSNPRLHECFYVQLWCNCLRAVQKRAGLAGLKTAISETNAQVAAFFFGNFIFEDYRQLHELYMNAGLFKYFDRTEFFEELGAKLKFGELPLETTAGAGRGEVVGGGEAAAAQGAEGNAMEMISFVLSRTTPEEVREDVFLARLVDTVVGVLFERKGGPPAEARAVSNAASAASSAASERNLPSSASSTASLAGAAAGADKIAKDKHPSPSPPRSPETINAQLAATAPAAIAGATTASLKSQSQEGHQGQGAASSSTSSTTEKRDARSDAFWVQHINLGSDPFLEHFFQQKKIQLLYEEEKSETNQSPSHTTVGRESRAARALGRILIDGLIFCCTRVSDMGSADVASIFGALLKRDSTKKTVALTQPVLRFLRSNLDADSPERLVVLQAAEEVLAGT